MTLYRGLPLIVVVIVVGAWTVGYRPAPVEREVQRVERTVEKPVIDYTELDRLRKQIAALTAEKDAAVARQKALRDLVERYQEELVAVDEALATREGGAK